MNDKSPTYGDELDRLLSLSDFDLDYSDLNATFQNLSTLAAKVAGTEISLVNLIDTHTQWTVSNHGLSLDQMPREDAVCHYTINSDEKLEVKDLSADERFSDKFYVSGELGLRYYFGVPLRTNTGQSLGALCVLDTQEKNLSPEKEELLKIIANEIVSRLKSLKLINTLRSTVTRLRDSHNRTIENMKSPLTGINGLAEIIIEQGKDNNMNEVLELVTMIHDSGKSLLDEMDDVLIPESSHSATENSRYHFTLPILKEKLLNLYLPQAKHKRLTYEIIVNPVSEKIPFSKDKVLQVAGNLVSNAIKFSGREGHIIVNLDLKIQDPKNILVIDLQDFHNSLSNEFITFLTNNPVSDIKALEGLQGYEFGIALVHHFVMELKGEMHITAIPGKGNRIIISLPRD